MHLLRTTFIAAAVSAVLAGCAATPTTQPSDLATAQPTTAPVETPIPATQPAEQATTTAAPVAAQIPEYAQERYRLVHGQDEIVSVLHNGCVIITKRVVGSPVLSVRGYVRAGGIYEGRWLGGGLSHLLEHLVAGGTNARRSEAQSRELLQQIGNNSNAYTTTNHTAYFVNTTPENLEKAADLVTGWMLHALITPEEFNREREVVQRELEMGKGEPGRQFYYMNQMNRYQVSPARVPVIGYQQVIQNLTRDDVYSYYQMAYQPNNMVFAIAGDLPPEQMLKTMQKYIDAPAGRVFDRTLSPEPAVLTPRTQVTTMPKIGEARALIEFPTIRLDHPDLYALDLLATVLGGGEGSVLTREIRDKQLATSISAYSGTPEYIDGSFGVSFQAKPEKLDAVIEAVQVILERAKREPLDEALLQRAKTQMRVGHLRELQETENVAATMARDFMSAGDVHFTQKYLDRVQRVTPADLQAVARKYFDGQRLIKTIMLPAEAVQGQNLPGAEAMLRQAGEQASTASAATQPNYEVQKSVLDNGTILLVRRVPTSPIIAVRMYAVGGLTAEQEANNGIGNLTMRMLTRGTSFRSAHQIAEQLDAMGASVETACGNNTWYWNASMLKEDFGKAMEIYADVVNNPAFSPEELEGMRKRVLAGIAAQDADWTSQAMRFFKRQFFPATSPYRMLTIGQADLVSRTQPQDLKDWYARNILKSRRVLAIYGDIDPETAKATAQKLLGSMPKVGSEAPARPAVAGAGVEVSDNRPQTAILRVEVQKTQQPLAGVIIGYEANSVIGDAKEAELNIADTMTSGWGYPTGYLHETLRGAGLVYVVAAQNSPGRSTQLPGTFFVYAGCEPSKVNEVIDGMLLNIARLQGKPEDIQPDWFDRCKQLLLTDEAMSKETVAEQATSAALDELWGLGFNYSKMLPERVNAVKLEDVQSLARQRLRRCIITVSTPDPDAVKIAPGIRVYDSFPPVELTPKGVQHDMPMGK